MTDDFITKAMQLADEMADAAVDLGASGEVDGSLNTARAALLAHLEGEAAEIDRILCEVSKVYNHVTGGLLSYPTYEASVVICEAEQAQSAWVDECIKEDREDYGADAASIAKILQSRLGSTRDHSGLSDCDKGIWDKCQRLIDAARASDALKGE